MAAAIQDITIEQGSDYLSVLTIKDNLAAPIDLTGYTFTSSISDETCEVVVASFTFNILNQTTNKGQVQWKMSSAVSATIPTNCIAATDTFVTTPYLYDVNMIEPSGFINRILRGKANVSPEVTK